MTVSLRGVINCGAEAVTGCLVVNGCLTNRICYIIQLWD